MIDNNYIHHIPKEVRFELVQLERKWFRDRPVYLVAFNYQNCPYTKMCNTIREVKKFGQDMKKMKLKDEATWAKVKALNENLNN